MIETQLASVLIDHVQSRAVVIVNDPCPPVAVNADGALLTPTWHLSAVGALSEVWVELQPAARQASAKAGAAARAVEPARHRDLPAFPSQSPRQIRV